MGRRKRRKISEKRRIRTGDKDGESTATTDQYDLLRYKLMNKVIALNMVSISAERSRICLFYCESQEGQKGKECL